MPRERLGEVYGNPIKYDPLFQGPQHSRSCTNITWLVAFISFLVLWAVISGYAVAKGDVRGLIAPKDSIGRKCGLDPGVENKSYLVFFDIKKCFKSTVKGCPTTQVCVNKCPEERLLYSEIENNATVDWKALKEKIVCTPETDLSDIHDKISLLNHLDGKQCARDIFPSKSLSKRCFPSNYTNFAELSLTTHKSTDDIEKFENVLSGANQMSTNIIEDLVNVRWWIVLGLVFVMLICLIYIHLLRWMAATIFWFSIVTCTSSLLIVACLSLSKYIYYRNHSAESTLHDENTWLMMMIVTWILLIFVIIMIVFLRKKIKLAIALIKEVSKAVGSIKSTLFFPIFQWIVEALVLGLGVMVFVYLISTGTPIYNASANNETECLKSCGFNEGDSCEPKSFFETCSSKCDSVVCYNSGTSYPLYVFWFQALNIFSYFWVIFFIEGLGELILAGAFATWYWTYEKSYVPFFTLSASIQRAFRYNLGTVAFGSFFITVCHLIRLFLQFVEKKTKGSDSILVRSFLCCMQCFFLCLERFLKFINRNAYIMCAVHGKGFMGSAKDAFMLLMRNILKIYVLDKVVNFLFWLSKILIALGCGMIAYFSLAGIMSGEEKLHYNFIPVLIIAIAAYLIASIFFGVYSMAVDTLFLCYLEDCERNDGSPEKPYFMSKELMMILAKDDDKLNGIFANQAMSSPEAYE